MLRTQTGLDKTPGINRTLALHDRFLVLLHILNRIKQHQQNQTYTRWGSVAGKALARRWGVSVGVATRHWWVQEKDGARRHGLA